MTARRGRTKRISRRPPDKPTLQEAMPQFWPEVYLTRADRDAALGMTRVPFCQYITAAAIVGRKVRLELV